MRSVLCISGLTCLQQLQQQTAVGSCLHSRRREVVGRFGRRLLGALAAAPSRLLSSVAQR